MQPGQDQYLWSLVCLAAFSLLSALTPAEAAEEFRGCDVADSRCLDDVFSAACMTRATTWPESCEVLLGELMQYPDNEPEILAHAGLANRILADQAESEADATSYRRAADALYRRVIALDPDHSGAYVGLAGTTDDPAEQIGWLRMAVRAGEPDSLEYRFLADALEQQGTRESRIESAAIMREAYENRPWDLHKWHLADWALGKYRRLGLDSEADEFRASVNDDIGFDELLASLMRAESEPENSVETLNVLCYEPVVAMFGAGHCISGAELLFAAAIRTAGSESSNRLAQAGLQRMRAAPFSSGGFIDRVPGVVDWLEQLADAGMESAELYFALGRCYLDLDRSPEAADMLRQLRSLSPRYWHDQLEDYLRIARTGEQHFCVERDTITVY